MDHYQRLRVSRDAPLEVIRAAYRALAAKMHPDRHGQSEGANHDMALLNAAYEVLSDPGLRADYDAGLAAAQPKPRPTADATRKATERSGAWRNTRFGADADDLSSVGSSFQDADATASTLEQFKDIDWDSLKAGAPVNPWLQKSRLVPMALAASFLVALGLVWWVQQITSQMDAERTLSAHLGQKGSPEQLVPPDVRSLEHREQELMARQVASAVGAAAPPVVSPFVPGVAPDKHLLDGEALNLSLDLQPNMALMVGAGHVSSATSP